ncbi:MAG: hypothetical protein WA125_06230 [Desulfosporosinus sp.]
MAKMGEGRNRQFQRTHYETKKAIQSVAETSIAQGNTTNTQSTMSAPGSGTPTTGKPQNISEIPIGIRIGFIERVDYGIGSPYRYLVKFPNTKTEVWARRVGELPSVASSGSGIVIIDPVWVGVSIEYMSFKWAIVGETEDGNY